MKKQLLYLILLLYPISIFSQDVSEQLAVQMANHYYQTLKSNTNEQNLKRVKAKIATSKQRLPALPLLRKQLRPPANRAVFFVQGSLKAVSGHKKFGY